MSEQVEIHEGSGEWSAVYLDGKLVRVGDHYFADEWVRDHFGVTTVQSDDFLRGQDQRQGVATTLDEVAAYRDARKARETRASELRAEAERLLAEAAALKEQPR